MRFVDVLRRLQGDDSQVKFARRLGIDQPELSRLLRGEREQPTRRTIVGLLRAFPDHRDEIVAALMNEGSQKTDANVAHSAPNAPPAGSADSTGLVTAGAPAE